MSRDGSLTRGLKLGNGSRLSTWLMDAATNIEQVQKDATLIELNLTQLTRLLNAIESQGCSNSAYGETEVRIVIALCYATLHSFFFNLLNLSAIISQ